VSDYFAAILRWCWKWTLIQRFIDTSLKVSSKTESVC